MATIIIQIEKAPDNTFLSTVQASVSASGKTEIEAIKNSIDDYFAFPELTVDCEKYLREAFGQSEIEKENSKYPNSEQRPAIYRAMRAMAKDLCK